MQRLLLALALTAAAVVLAGCASFVALPLVTSWAQTLTTTVVLALFALVVFAVRRQRTANDDRDLVVRRALSKHTTDARYTYYRRTDGETEYDWDAVDHDFPLGWRTGFLKGKTLADVLPYTDNTAEAYAAYNTVLNDRVPVTYLRTEADRVGRLITVRYSHVPLPSGGGACIATPLSPQIDAVRDERDVLCRENERMKATITALEGDVAGLRESARRERALYAAATKAQP